MTSHRMHLTARPRLLVALLLALGAFGCARDTRTAVTPGAAARELHYMGSSSDFIKPRRPLWLPGRINFPGTPYSDPHYYDDRDAKQVLFAGDHWLVVARRRTALTLTVLDADWQHPRSVAGLPPLRDIRDRLHLLPDKDWKRTAVVARTGLAEVLKAQAHYQEAETLYRETMARFPEDVVARNGLASLLAELHRVVEALVVLPPTTVLRSRDDWVNHHLRAMILLRQGERDGAVALLRAGYPGCPFPEQRDYYRSALAFDALRHGELGTAEDLLRDASPFPENERFLDIARAHLAAAQDAASARPILERLQDQETLTEPKRRVLRLINTLYGVFGPPAPESERLALRQELLEAELALAA